jgi:hypothetical protein
MPLARQSQPHSPVTVLHRFPGIEFDGCRDMQPNLRKTRDDSSKMLIRFLFLRSILAFLCSSAIDTEKQFGFVRLEMRKRYETRAGNGQEPRG